MLRTLRHGLRSVALLSAAAAVLAGGAATALLAACGPFTDVTDPAFCSNVLEIYTLNITTGTTPTTYSPGDPVTRIQMAIFLSREADRILSRGSRRAALKEFWTPGGPSGLALTTVGSVPVFVRSDGTDLWVSNFSDASVSRVRAGDGKLLGTWGGATSAQGVLVAMGDIFVTGYESPGKLYRIEPDKPAGSVTLVASNIGIKPGRAAFDGLRIWTANHVFGGSVSIVTPGASLPWTVTTVTAGFIAPIGVLYDGSSIWASDSNAGALFKLDGSGAILQTVTVGLGASSPLFDGSNIWTPVADANEVVVVRASNGAVLATLTGNGLDFPTEAAFDGQRILVTNYNGNSVSLWKAASLTPLGSVPVGVSPLGACSDGVNFWITLSGTNHLARF